MCRFCAIIANDPLTLAEILTRPKVSLIRQSFASQERERLPKGTIASMAYQQSFLNGDGYGLGWYTMEVDDDDGACIGTASGAGGGGGGAGSAGAAGGGGGFEEPVTAGAGGETQQQEQEESRLKISIKPCVFTSLKPAWNDRNLKRLAERLSSDCILAHVRAAGPGSAVTEDACHPFE